MNKTQKIEEKIQNNKIEIQNTLNELSNDNTMSEEVINSLPGIFYMFNKKGRFVKWNRNFEIVSECSYDEVAKSSPLDYFTGETKKELHQKY